MPAERRRRRHARNERMHDSTGKKRGLALSRRSERQEARGAHCSRSSKRGALGWVFRALACQRPPVRRDRDGPDGPERR